MTWLRPDPVLLVGMHRSGTTMLARMLADLGVFLGHHLEQNHEAVAFLDRNDDVLARAHATWDRPLGVLELLEHPGACRAVAESLRRSTGTLKFRRSYLGAKRIARGPGEGPWGFKDPRTTVTWPLWLELMPEPKLVYVRRHGVDVAASLWRRARKELDEQPHRFAGDPHLARFASVRCLDLARAFELWGETEVVFDLLRARHPGVPVLELVYEDFLADPAAKLREVASFLELRVDDATIERVAAAGDSSRALAHRDDPELRDFAASVREDPRLDVWERPSRG